MACPLSIPAETSWVANHEDALNSVIVNCQANWRPRLTNPAQSSLHDIPQRTGAVPLGQDRPLSGHSEHRNRIDW
jgi:hypothetical protein